MGKVEGLCWWAGRTLAELRANEETILGITAGRTRWGGQLMVLMKLST